jgi:hypothetical protein
MLSGEQNPGGTKPQSAILAARYAKKSRSSSMVRRLFSRVVVEPVELHPIYVGFMKTRMSIIEPIQMIDSPSEK